MLDHVDQHKRPHAHADATLQYAFCLTVAGNTDQAQRVRKRRRLSEPAPRLDLATCSSTKDRRCSASHRTPRSKPKAKWPTPLLPQTSVALF